MLQTKIMISHNPGLKFRGHDCHFKLHEFAGADLSSEMKKLGLSMFCCLLLALASQKERKQ